MQSNDAENIVLALVYGVAEPASRKPSGALGLRYASPEPLFYLRHALSFTTGSILLWTAPCPDFSALARLGQNASRKSGPAGRLPKAELIFDGTLSMALPVMLVG